MGYIGVRERRWSGTLRDERKETEARNETCGMIGEGDFYIIWGLSY